MSEPTISVNINIKGIGSTTLSMDDAKKLHAELDKLFAKKVEYYLGQWRWKDPYPYWDYWRQGIYGTWCSSDTTKGINDSSGGGGSQPTGYNISI